VAQRARAFGARITGVRRNPAADPAAHAIAPPEAVAALLPESDVVVLSVPLTPGTRRMVDEAFVAAMKPRSMLVNVGRGGLVDEPALLAGLDRGVPEHALLDVFAAEPLPADSPFWDHPRVTLTPHASGISEGQAARNDGIFIENLGRYVRGEPLLHEASPADVLGA
jgi:phosphoglycerate dehydrogenase-like enzyme